LEEVARYTKELAPWHGWSVCRREEKGVFISAEDLCGEKIAHRSLKKAERAFEIAKDFIQAISPP